MARRRWTVLILSEDQASVRQFQLSRELVRFTIAGGLILLSVLTSLAAGFFVRQGQRMRAERLERENGLLTAEVQTIRERLATLERTLQELSEKDEQYRVLAGLEPLDPDVQKAGVGGPGTPGMATLTGSELYRISPEKGELAFSTAYDLNAMIRRAELLARSWTEATEALEEERERLASTPSIRPTSGYLSSSFSRNRWHPILNRARPHEGIDIAAVAGTPVLAAAKGRVTYAGYGGDYGWMVEIDHGHGLVTRYAHMLNRPPVSKGQRVERWQKIGEVGATGLASAPHLHYEVLRNGVPINPSNFFFDAGKD
ncbi:MAG TPA: M23 family metallopeptidase [Longimicrobiales bacterium]